MNQKQVLQIKVVGSTSIGKIPPHVRTSHRGKREDVMRPVIEHLLRAPKGEVLVIEHNSPSAQYLHGRVFMRRQERGLDFKVRCAVRGNKAYIWRP